MEVTANKPKYNFGLKARQHSVRIILVTHWPKKRVKIYFLVTRNISPYKFYLRKWKHIGNFYGNRLASYQNELLNDSDIGETDRVK